MMRNGKQTRARLVAAWCAHCGGQTEKAYALGTVIELIHGASLLQDDIIDKAEIRRGQPTLWKQRSREYAMLESVALLGEAFDLLGHCELSDEAKVEVIKELGSCLSIMANGAQNEYEGASKDWQFIYRAKTGILFETACVLGVIAANGIPEQIAQAREYGRNLGMAYQIMDDIEDQDGLVEVYGEHYAKIYLEEFQKKYRSLANKHTEAVIE